MTTSRRTTLEVNGTALGVAEGASVATLEGPLRAVARSDSPVLIAGGYPDDREAVASALHRLGTRKGQALHTCSDHRAAGELLRAISEGHAGREGLGTWVLRELPRWPRAAQERLGEALEILDTARLAERAPREELPRILALVQDLTSLDSLPEPLRRRLAYFRLTLVTEIIDEGAEP